MPFRPRNKRGGTETGEKLLSVSELLELRVSVLSLLFSSIKELGCSFGEEQCERAVSRLGLDEVLIVCCRFLGIKGEGVLPLPTRVGL